MKKVYRMLLIVSIVWTSVTLFFYSQHRVMVRVCNVDQEIIVGDYTLIVDYVVIKSHERRTDLRMEDSLFFKYAHRLPSFMLKPGFYIATFYNRPYEFNNKLQNTIVKTQFVLDKAEDKSEDETYYFDIGEKAREAVSIKLIDSIGAGYSSRTDSQSNSESNIMHYWVSGERFPKERINEPVTIVITDKVNDITHEIAINPEDFKKESYGFFNRSPYENYYK